MLELEHLLPVFCSLVWEFLSQVVNVADLRLMYLRHVFTYSGQLKRWKLFSAVLEEGSSSDVHIIVIFWSVLIYIKIRPPVHHLIYLCVDYFKHLLGGSIFPFLVHRIY